MEKRRKSWMRRASIPLPIPCEGITLPFELHTHFGSDCSVLYLSMLPFVVFSFRIHSFGSLFFVHSLHLGSAMMSANGIVSILIWGGSSLAVLSTLLVSIFANAHPSVIRDLKQPHQQEILSDYILSKVIFTVRSAWIGCFVVISSLSLRTGRMDLQL